MNNLDEVKVLMISGGSPTKETAGSIVKCYVEGKYRNIELKAIGAGAVNQAVKAIATARSIFAQRGVDLSCKPGYDEAYIDGNKRTVIIFRLIIE